MFEKDDKTEKPTPHTYAKAKERGELAHSTELAAAILLAGALLLLWGLKKLINDRLKGVFLIAASSLAQPDLLKAMRQVLQPIFLPMAILFSGLVLIVIGASWVQKGGIHFTKRRKHKKKEPPRIFYILLKTGVFACIGFFFIFWKKPAFNLIFSTSAQKMHVIFFESFLLSLALAAALLILGFGDFFYQKWRWNRQLHMNKQEAKDEQKETEGSPLKKRRIRRTYPNNRRE